MADELILQVYLRCVKTEYADRANPDCWIPFSSTYKGSKFWRIFGSLSGWNNVISDFVFYASMAEMIADAEDGGRQNEKMNLQGLRTDVMIFAIIGVVVNIALSYFRFLKWTSMVDVEIDRVDLDVASNREIFCTMTLGGIVEFPQLALVIAVTSAIDGWSSTALYTYWSGWLGLSYSVYGSIEWCGKHGGIYTTDGGLDGDRKHQNRFSIFTGGLANMMEGKKPQDEEEGRMADPCARCWMPFLSFLYVLTPLAILITFCVLYKPIVTTPTPTLQPSTMPTTPL